jgi:beta-lactamase superfamily II metal-dependent hydrolase
LHTTYPSLVRSVRAIDVENAALEVDFLPVGDGHKGGDAIAVRFGDLTGRRDAQFVMVIDGGTQDSGAALVDHVRKYYGTEQVDLAVSTHPDADHASGLKVVLEKLDVKRLWIHRPWEHASNIHELFRSARLTNTSLERYIRKSLTNAHDLEDVADKRGIPIDEPFSNEALPFRDIGIFVLGPSKHFYEDLLPNFRSTPEAKAAEDDSFLLKLIEAAKSGAKQLLESWGIETLSDPEENATSAENNSSVVLLLKVGGKALLFTGDAGVPALELAADHADALGVSLQAASFIQIPHHGSRRNVGPSILNRIIGPKLSEGSFPKVTAFVSCCKDGNPKHPAKKVTNAFQRRGANVIATRGNSIRHGHNAPDRPGWGPASPVPFYSEVDE